MHGLIFMSHRDIRREARIETLDPKVRVLEDAHVDMFFPVGGT